LKNSTIPLTFRESGFVIVYTPKDHCGQSRTQIRVCKNLRSWNATFACAIMGMSRLINVRENPFKNRPHTQKRGGPLTAIVQDRTHTFIRMICVWFAEVAFEVCKKISVHCTLKSQGKFSALRNGEHLQW